MRRIVLATLTVLAAIGLFGNASAQTITYTVDCKGDRRSPLLWTGGFSQPLVINLRGICREFVTITRANVTLRGNPVPRSSRRTTGTTC